MSAKSKLQNEPWCSRLWAVRTVRNGIWRSFTKTGTSAVVHSWQWISSGEGERLRQVIVPACAQPLYPIIDLAQRREDQDRRADLGRPHRLDQARYQIVKLAMAEAPAHLNSIVAAIQPAVETTRGATVEATIKANIENVVQSLRSSEPVLRKEVEAGAITVLGAYYNLDTGTVTFIEDKKN